MFIGWPMFHEFRASTGHRQSGSYRRNDQEYYRNDYDGFQGGSSGTGFGNGFFNFGPSMFQRTYTSRANEYGWRY